MLTREPSLSISPFVIKMCDKNDRLPLRADDEATVPALARLIQTVAAPLTCVDATRKPTAVKSSDYRAITAPLPPTLKRTQLARPPCAGSSSARPPALLSTYSAGASPTLMGSRWMRGGCRSPPLAPVSPRARHGTRMAFTTCW